MILLTNTNTRSILIISGTQEDLPDHTNGVGSTSGSDKPSLTHTHRSIARNGRDLERRIALVNI